MKILIDSVDTYLPIFIDIINSSMMNDTFFKAIKLPEAFSKNSLNHIQMLLRQSSTKNICEWSLPVIHKDLYSAP